MRREETALPATKVASKKQLTKREFMSPTGTHHPLGPGTRLSRASGQFASDFPCLIWPKTPLRTEH